MSAQQEILRRIAPVLTCLACAQVANASGPAVFDGYEAYYATLPDPMFLSTDEQPLRLGTAPSGLLRLFWEGVVLPNVHTSVVELSDADIVINGRRFSARDALRFPGEITAKLGDRATVYVNKDSVCVQGVAPSTSGTASRHVHVSLILHAFAQDGTRYELPSLFGSCRALHYSDGRKISFYKANFHFVGEQDNPDGALLNEYVLDSRQFLPADRYVRITFTEPGNVYRFSVVKDGVR